MKKLTTMIVLMIIVFSTYAIAQTTFDVNGQVRSRLQINDKDFNSETGMNTFNELRTRLGIKFTPIDDVLGFIQIQDSRVYGTEAGTMADMKNLDLHQGYFAVKNIFKLPADLQVGRMELAFANQRLIGSVGWHNVGRSFDGSVLNLHTEQGTIGLVTVRTNESGIVDDSSDFHISALLGDLKFVENMKIQPYVITEMLSRQDFSRYTLGVYIAGKIGGLSHEIEGSYQMGTQQKDVDIAAFMFAFNLKYALKGSLKPSIGVGVDYLSGDDGEDETKYKVFNTLYATNHKFYGFMDYFLNIPVHTYGKGLIDIHAKASIVPFDKFTVAASFHNFSANADYILADETTSTAFGTEIDITAIYKYNKAVKFQGGFSMFSPGAIFKETKGKDAANYAYLMAIVNL